MKLKVAILEDSKLLLKELKQNLEETGLIEVVVWATNSDEFLQKISQSQPEALLLDIDLGGDSMSGIDIAYHLKLPVLFVSGKTQQFHQKIEEHYINSALAVQRVTKPITIDKLRKVLPKFINEIDAISKTQYLHLDFATSKKNKISMNSIVYLGTDKANGAESNNKQIFFSDRKPEILVDFSFSQMNKMGFNENKFITIHKSFRVNVDAIQQYQNTHEVEVIVMNGQGKTEKKLLSVSENYRKLIPGLKL